MLRALLVVLLAASHAASAQEPADTVDSGDDSWFAGPALADRDGAAKDWGVDVLFYGWLINLDGDITAPPTGTIPFSTTFSNAKSGLQGAFAGFLDARWRRWHLMVDGSWVKLGGTGETSLGGLSSGLDVEQAFGLVGAAYELPVDLGFAWDVYMGARWWDIDTTVTLTPPNPAATPISGTAGVAWADFIAGTRLRHSITDHWRVFFLGDVGGGAAKLDWQVLGGLAYDFNRHVGLTAAYRIMGVDYSNRSFSYDITQQGLLLGLRVGF